MATNAEKAVEIFTRYIGKAESPGDWFLVDQERINKFADCTIDHQFIHVDRRSRLSSRPTRSRSRTAF